MEEYCYKVINVIPHKIKFNNNNIYITPVTPLIQPHSLAGVDRITGVFLMFSIYVLTGEALINSRNFCQREVNHHISGMRNPSEDFLFG